MGKNFERELTVAVSAVRTAGEYLLKRRCDAGDLQVDEKGIGDFVTEADRESERLVTECITSVFSEDSIVAEESGVRGRNNARRWFIDPLDGTANYVHDISHYCVSIGFMEEGVICAGAVYDPCRDELFTAARGGGAFLNGRPVSVNRSYDRSRSVIATGFPFRNRRYMDTYLKSFRAVTDITGGIRRMGAAALDLCYTAMGRVDGFWELGLSSWDVAAGSLIVLEAGGTVSDFDGEDGYLDSGNTLGASAACFPLLLKAVRTAMSGTDLVRWDTDAR
ncbi:MAG: inositol monophosphatase [Deltaproteobacteria bacterium]|nr:inositol monophosphatase [Candidatus Zymogenaceae bacterium]